MSLANKVFRNNKTGESIRVIDSFENIAILENKQKIDVRALMDSNQYTEQIDPASFFNNQNAYNSLVDKIKSMPIDNLRDDPKDFTSRLNEGVQPAMNESAIIMSSEEDERAELARKYGVDMDATSQIQKQNDAFARILGEEADEVIPVPEPIVNQPEVQRFEIDRTEQNRPQVNNLPGHSNPPEPPAQRVEIEDPIITMFKKTKRNVDFKINIELNDKLPRLDFIEMMEDSYEISMIDFLADDFTNKILENPSLIRDKIKERIKQLVYGGEVQSKINDQITDSVTQVNPPTPPDNRIIKEGELPTKPKTTRKPRTKKESTEK
jgi:hypothetical protein